MTPTPPAGWTQWIWVFVLFGFVGAAITVTAIAPAAADGTVTMLLARKFGTLVAGLGIGAIVAAVFGSSVKTVGEFGLG